MLTAFARHVELIIQLHSLRGDDGPELTETWPETYPTPAEGLGDLTSKDSAIYIFAILNMFADHTVLAYTRHIILG